MATKNTQLSVRITDEDAAFLARLEIEGAQTPSDKIRALLGEARRRHEGRRDYRAALARSAELLGPAAQEVRAAENAVGTRSELLRLVVDWLPEGLAFLVSRSAEGEGADPRKLASALRVTEAGLADRVFSLADAVLRLGVTEEAPCHDRGAISSRLAPILNLLDVLRTARSSRQPGMR
jgi:hypothetical protein